MPGEAFAQTPRERIPDYKRWFFEMIRTKHPDKSGVTRTDESTALTSAFNEAKNGSPEKLLALYTEFLKENNRADEISTLQPDSEADIEKLRILFEKYYDVIFPKFDIDYEVERQRRWREDLFAQQRKKADVPTPPYIPPHAHPRTRDEEIENFFREFDPYARHETASRNTVSSEDQRVDRDFESDARRATEARLDTERKASIARGEISCILDGGREVFLLPSRTEIGGLRVGATLKVRLLKLLAVPVDFRRAESIVCEGFTRDGEVVLRVKSSDGKQRFVGLKASWVAEHLTF